MSEVLECFKEKNEKLKEIFGNNNVYSETLISVYGFKKLHVVQRISKLDTLNNERLQEIIKNDNIKFKDCDFEYLFINDFKNLIFEKCKIGGFVSNETDENIKENLTFNECEFSYDIELAPTNYKNITFNNCEIKSNIIAKNVKFENFDCKNNHFLGCVDFSNSTFDNNVFFNNCIFDDLSDFHECRFNDTACFYGVEFNSAFNFSQCVFEKNINLVNSNLNFTINTIEKTIENELKRRENRNKNGGSSKEKVANDFRDSFRLFKSALIGENNLLDASKYRKMELYCKEIELKEKLKNEQIKIREYNKKLKDSSESSNTINITHNELIINLMCGLFLGFLLCLSKFHQFGLIKSALTSFLAILLVYTTYIIVAFSIYFVYYASQSYQNIRKSVKRILAKKLINFDTWVDYVVLRIYRNTSDHHTNLNITFQFVLMMICVYWLNVSILNKFHEFAIGYEYFYILAMPVMILSIFGVILHLEKQMSDHSLAICLLFAFVVTLLYPITLHYSYALFNIVFYITTIVFAYFLFLVKNNLVVIVTRGLFLLIIMIVLISEPRLINPTYRLFSQTNTQNENLSKLLSSLDYDILSHLTKLSYEILDADKISVLNEEKILQQKEIIIQNKNRLKYNIKKLLKQEDGRLKYILKNKDNPKEIFNDIKFRSSLLDLLYIIDGAFQRNLKDIEIRDDFRVLWEDQNVIENEKEKIANLFSENRDRIESKIKAILDNKSDYNKIYRAIAKDEISRSHNATYILYILLMILCVYSFTKTARKASIVSG